MCPPFPPPVTPLTDFVIQPMLSSLLLACSLTGFLSGAAEAPEAARGKEIYLTGKSPGGSAITARLGGTQVAVPAAVMPCVNCHGPDGRGRPESGVVPSDITWATLTRPYIVRTATGREPLPYDEALLARAIGEGIDSAGNRLEETMPRFNMSARDMADLVAYMRLIGTEPEPGVSDEVVVVGVLLPPRTSPLARILRPALDAWFGDLNARGGIYGRRVEPQYRQPGGDAAERIRLARELMEGEIFLLLAPFIAGIEQEIAALAADRGVPVIAPFTRSPRVGFPPNRQVFYLYAGLDDQVRALLNYAAGEFPGRPLAAVVHPGHDPLLENAANTLEDLNGAENWAHLRTFAADRGFAGGAALAGHLKQLGIELVFYLGLGSAAEDKAFATAVASLDWSPVLLLPSGYGGELARGDLTRTILAFPTTPGDMNQDGAKRYARLLEHYPLPQRPSASWLAALGGAALLENGLQSAGRELTREKLITSLERLYEWSTGFTPPVTYNPNRRIGARGAYILDLNPRDVDASQNKWVEALNPPSQGFD